MLCLRLHWCRNLYRIGVLVVYWSGLLMVVVAAVVVNIILYTVFSSTFNRFVDSLNQDKNRATL